MTSLHVKNNLKMYKNTEKGRSKCKKSSGETKQRIHKKEKESYYEFHVKIAFLKEKNDKNVGL